MTPPHKRCGHTRHHVVSAIAALVVMALTALTAIQPATAADPAFRPDGDAGGTAIALLGRGVDYTQPVISACLARDGEGEPISWDFQDNDERPYAPGTPKAGGATAGTATDIARALCKPPRPLRLIIVRENATDPFAIGHMVMFVARTPARVVVWPDGAPTRTDWPVLAEALMRMPHLTFIVPAWSQQPAAPTTPNAAARDPSNAPNLIAVPRRRTRDGSANLIAITRKVADALAKRPGLSPAELKQAVTPKAK